MVKFSIPTQPPSFEPITHSGHVVVLAHEGVQDQRSRQRPLRQLQDYIPLEESLSVILPMVRPLLKELIPRSLSNPLPKWYDLTAYCDFHHVVGHTTDRCLTLKDVVQDLIDDGVVIVGTPGQPSPDCSTFVVNHAPFYSPLEPSFDPSFRVAPALQAATSFQSPLFLSQLE